MLIKFETAKLAKEKGFIEICGGYYTQELHDFFDIEYSKNHESRKGFNTRKDRIYYTNDTYTNSEDYSNNRFYCVAAPTQSELHKWLRDKHGINISIMWEGEDAHSMCYYPIIKYDDTTLPHKKKYKRIITIDNNGIGAGYGYWETYEEALEEGLIEALKLI